MEKKVKLTKREKTLIFVTVGIVAVFLLVTYVYMPAYNNYLDAKQKNEELVFQTDEMMLTAAQEPLAKTAKEEAETRLAENKEFFSPPLTDFEIDQYITRLCESSGFQPTRLQIESVTPVIVEVPEEDAEETPDESGGEATPTPAPEPSEEAVEEQMAYPVNKAVVAVEGTGSIATMKTLMRKISETSFLELQSLKYIKEGDAASIVFDLYMNNAELAV